MTRRREYPWPLIDVDVYALSLMEKRMVLLCRGTGGLYFIYNTVIARERER